MKNSKKSQASQLLDTQKKKLVQLLILAVLLVAGAWLVINGQSLWDLRGWAGQTCKSAKNEKSCSQLGCRWIPGMTKQTFTDCKPKDCDNHKAGCRMQAKNNGNTRCEGRYLATQEPGSGSCIGTPTVANKYNNNGNCFYHGADYRDGEHFYDGWTPKVCRKGDVYPIDVEGQGHSSFCRNDASNTYSFIRCDSYG